MAEFYFAIGSDPCDVFIVVNGNWIPYKRCETEEIAKALVTGQNESRGGLTDGLYRTRSGSCKMP